MASVEWLSKRCFFAIKSAKVSGAIPMKTSFISAIAAVRVYFLTSHLGAGAKEVWIQMEIYAVENQIYWFK